VTLIKKHLGIDAVGTPGATGQFDVLADGQTVAQRGGNFLTRRLGAGYPELNSVVDLLVKKHRASEPAR